MPADPATSTVATAGRTALKPRSIVSVPAGPRPRPTARFVLHPEALDQIYPAAVRAQIEALVDLQGGPLAPDQVDANPEQLAGVRALFSGWGAPRLTEAVLDAAVGLEVVFYGAGAINGFYTDAARERGIQVTSCNAINATPVVEYTLAQIIMCLKRIWQQAFELRASRRWLQSHPGATGFGSTVGLLSLGDIGLRVAQRLADMDVRVMVYDIHPDPALARRFSFEYADLDTVFRTADVVSVHTPLLPETRGLVTGPLLASMKPGASLINTARGGVIDQPALVDVFRRREDLFAVLDVVDPEPPSADDPVWQLANVVLTPHLAGSVGRECERMGQTMLEELRRYRAGEPLKWLAT